MTIEYQEKPKKVQAKRFDGNSEELISVLTWIQDRGYTLYDTFSPAPSRGVSIMPSTGFLTLIDSKGDFSSVLKGDWVILQPNGDFKKMSNSEFEATYAPLEDQLTITTPIDIQE